MPKKIAPSILAADFTRLAEEVRAVETAGADWIHLDVMDGHFVPNLTMGPPVVEAVRRLTELPLDVHLMIEDPDRWLGDYAEAGGSILTVHAEACTHLQRTLQHIRDLGKLAGVALNPHTPLDVLEYVLDDADVVLVMSVNPGFAGQKFLPLAVAKVAELKRRLQGRTRSPLVEVDGGINERTAAAVGAADVFVAGSGIFRAVDYSAALRKIRGAAEAAA